MRNIVRTVRVYRITATFVCVLVDWIDQNFITDFMNSGIPDVKYVTCGTSMLLV